MTQQHFFFRRGAAVAAWLVAAASLPGCASLGASLSGPSSRGMSLSTLNQQVRPGMSQQDVLGRLGYPTYTFPIGWQKQTVWNYRFAPPEGDCTVFQVSFANATGTVVETGQGQDRYCDGPNRS